MVDYYISPNGTGTKSGVGIKNASTLSQLDTLLAKAKPGDRVLLIADQGDYKISKSINVTHGGSDAGAITIKGISSSGADMAATFVSNRANVYSPLAATGQDVFRLLDGANHLKFENMAFEKVNTAFRLAGTIEDITLQHMSADNINRFAYNLSADTGSATVSGLVIRDVDVTGFAKAVVSLRYDTNNVLIEDVSGDSQHVDGSNFATGVQLEGTVHAVVVKDTRMGNITDTVNAYRNGDGFATEESVHDVAFINTLAYNNTDAGYDLKSSDTTLINAVAQGNTRNFRLWADDTVLENVSGVDPAYHGGISTTPANIWLGANARVTIRDSEFTDKSGKALLFDMKDTGAILTVDNVLSNQLDLSDIARSATSKLIGAVKSLVTLPKPEPGARTTINGTAANDVLNGTTGDDDITGGNGQDQLWGGKGNDFLHGGSGNDVFAFEGNGFGKDVIADFSRSIGNQDKIDVSRMKVSFADMDLKVVGKDAVISFASGDTITVKNVTGLTKADIIAATAPESPAPARYERVVGSGIETNKTTYILAAGLKDLTYDGEENFRGVGNARDNLISGGTAQDTLEGGDGNDKLYGLAGNDWLLGGRGNDTLYGRQNNDTLFGEDGADNLMGDGGRDVLNGGRGNDVMAGGADADRFVVNIGDGSDIIADFGADDIIDFTASRLKLADIRVQHVADGILIRYGAMGLLTDSLLLKGAAVIDTDQLLFGA